MPKLITRKHLAESAKFRFAKQYGPAFGKYLFGDSAAVYKELLKLGDEPSIADVERLLPGWTWLTCDECGKDVNQVMQVGQKPNYESSTAAICQDCANTAVRLFIESHFGHTP